MFQRVQKILSNRGYCSRRNAELLISRGRVKVDDKVITLGDKADENQIISVDNKIVKEEKKTYLIFNKPRGYVTALIDSHERTIMELIDVKERVYPVGRLDKNTEGILLLTNDGDFANKIMHPRYCINKTYLVRINKPINGSHMGLIIKGVKLEDGKTAPAQVKKLSDFKLEITIHEGKNRIIRRMLEKLGYEVRHLKRIYIGNLDLGTLNTGQYISVSKSFLEEKIF